MDGFIFMSTSFRGLNRNGILDGIKICGFYIFYAPGLNGPPGASSNQIVRLSVRNSVPLTNKVQYFKFG